MQLSVIIVNYNVAYFLEQALLSVRKAAEGLAVEVIVVDNHSKDGSAEMVREQFPEVQLIANRQNTGFSKANNQGIQIAKGKYILLLNPDTVVAEDTFRKCLTFMDAHPKAGALGVKMVDGTGRFLPESKRGLPTPAVAFYKIFGLSGLFPHSPTFSRYHLGHLGENATHEVDILSGAFMFMRKEALDKAGMLDETFFMYGEDIDLSYRIQQAGFKNYYFADTTIIHYKGESTKKGSLNYVRMFYQAMSIFARKHFSAKQAGVYNAAINIAIFLRALVAVFSRMLFRTLLPLTDALLIFGGMYAIKGFWENNIKAAEHTTYPPEYLLINVPLYILIWLLTMFFSGGYDRPLKVSRIVRGLLVGTVIISAVYGFLPESLRFSRGMIVTGAAWSVFALVGLRVLLHFFKYKNFDLDEAATKKAVIVGSLEECRRVRTLLTEANVSLDLIGYVLPEAAPLTHKRQIGDLSQLSDFIRWYGVNEVIFCGKDVPNQTIIGQMADVGPSVSYKIVPADSEHIIGSNSKNTAGDYYVADTTFHLSQTHYRRNKQVLDLLVCGMLLLLLPAVLVVVKNRPALVKNWWQVLWGKRTWVGYAKGGEQSNLPPLKKGVLSPCHAFPLQDIPPETAQKLNHLYAKDYTTRRDLVILWKGFADLGG